MKRDNNVKWVQLLATVTIACGIIAVLTARLHTTPLTYIMTGITLLAYTLTLLIIIWTS